MNLTESGRYLKGGLLLSVEKGRGTKAPANRAKRSLLQFHDYCVT